MEKWKEMLKEAKELFDEGLIDEIEYKELKTQAIQQRTQGKQLDSATISSNQQDTFMGKTTFGEIGSKGFGEMPSNYERDSSVHFEEAEREIGQYRLLSKLGAGGMGTVYRARHKVEGFAMQTGDVAIKIMNPEVSKNEEYKTRFIMEAGIGRAISHENITKIHDIIIEKNTGVLALVMDLVQGNSLEKEIPEEGMSFEEALPIIEQLCDALDYIHEQGIIHRDLKPENIIISPEGKAIILDLGIAKNTKNESISQTRTGLAMGTPLYMAPEQLDAKSVSSAADRYSLGLIVYKLLSGKLPWKENLGAGEILSAKFLGRLETLSEQPDNIWKAIEDVLQPDSQKRTGSCAQFLLNLQKEETEESIEEFSVEEILEIEEPFSGNFQDLDLPELGEGIEVAIILQFLKGVGDFVEEGESFVLVEAGGENFEISSNMSGELVDFFFDEGDEVLIGEAIACLEPIIEEVDQTEILEESEDALENIEIELDEMEAEEQRILEEALRLKQMLIEFDQKEEYYKENQRRLVVQAREMEEIMSISAKIDEVQKEIGELKNKQAELNKGFFSFLNQGEIQIIEQKIQQLEEKKADITKPLEKLTIKRATKEEYEQTKREAENAKKSIWVWRNKKKIPQGKLDGLKAEYEERYPAVFNP